MSGQYEICNKRYVSIADSVSILFVLVTADRLQSLYSSMGTHTYFSTDLPVCSAMVHVYGKLIMTSAMIRSLLHVV